MLQEGRLEEEIHKRELAEQLQGEADTERTQVQVNALPRSTFGQPNEVAIIYQKLYLQKLYELISLSHQV